MFIVYDLEKEKTAKCKGHPKSIIFINSNPLCPFSLDESKQSTHVWSRGHMIWNHGPYEGLHKQLDASPDSVWLATAP